MPTATAPRSEFPTAILLAGLIALSTGLHLRGIKGDLPFVPEADEPIAVVRAAQIAATHDLNPHWFGHPGSTVIYPLAAVYAVRRLVADPIDWPAVVQDLRGYDPAHADLYLLGRLLSIAYAALMLPLVFLLGRNVFDRRVGWLGALVSIFFPVAIWHAQIVRTDSAGAFFTVLALWLCMRLYDRPALATQVLAGAAIGLAISTRYFMLTLVPIWFAVSAIAVWRSAGRRAALLQAGAGLAAIGAIFALTSPFVLLDFPSALGNLRTEARSTQLGADGLSFLGNLRWYLAQAIPLSMSKGHIVLLAAGMLAAACGRSTKPRLLLLFLAVYWVAVSASALHWQRWIIACLPVFALFIARALVGLAEAVGAALNWPPAARTAAAVLGALLLLATPARDVTAYAARRSEPSTRVLARQWMDANLPAGSRITQEWFAAPLAGSTFEVTEVASLAEWGARLDGDGTGSAASGDATGGAAVSGGAVAATAVPEVVVASSWTYWPYFDDPARYRAEAAFYDRLMASGALLQEFAPGPARDGPTLRIFTWPPGR